MAFNLGDIFVTLKAKTEGVDQALAKMNDLGGKVNDGVEKTNKGAAIAGAVAGVVASVASRGIDLVSNAIQSAEKRVDTLSNANRVFANMGFSADDTKKAMSRLDDSIKGLPTSLSDAVSGVEMIAASTQDVGKSQEIFAALNNGILGFGGSADMVKTTVLQLSQGFANGKIDAETWNSMMQNGLGPTLNAMAKQMGMTTGEMKKGLSDGSISVGKFQDALIEMNKKGGGGMASLQKIAKDSTSGIQTSTENAQTAIARGIAKIITAIGTDNIAKAIKAIGSAFEDALAFVGMAIDKFQAFGGFLKDHKKVIEEVAVVLTALFLPAILAIGYNALVSFGLYLAGLAASIAATAIGAVQMAASWLLAMGPLGLIGAAVIAVVALIIANWDTVKQWLASFWGWLKNTASDAWEWVHDKVIAPVINKIISIFDTLKDGAMAVWNAIKDGATAAWDVISSAAAAAWDFIFNTVISPVMTLIGGLFEIWLAIVTYVFDVIRGLALVTWWEIHDKIIKPVVDGIILLFNALMGVIIGVWNAIKDAAIIAWNWLYDKVIQPVIDRLIVAFNFYKGIALAVWDAIKGAAEAAWNWIYSKIVQPVIDRLVNAFNFYKGIAIGVWNTIKSVGSTVWDAISSGFSSAWNRVTAIWNSAKSFFAGIWKNIVSGASGIAGGVATGFTSAFEGAKNIAKGAVNWMIDKVNAVIRGVNSSAGKLPGVPDIPQIPKLAQGIRNFAGGLATVGEMGRETLWIPPGASVFSSADTSRMATAGGGGPQVYIDMAGANITSPQVAEDYAEAIGDKIVDKLRKNVRL